MLESSWPRQHDDFVGSHQLFMTLKCWLKFDCAVNIRPNCIINLKCKNCEFYLYEKEENGGQPHDLRMQGSFQDFMLLCI